MAYKYCPKKSSTTAPFYIDSAADRIAVMTLLSILLIAPGLAMDAFAVSITSGITIKNLKVRHALLVGGVFGIFQAVMPVLGWAIGQWAYRFISAIDYWIAFGLHDHSGNAT